MAKEKIPSTPETRAKKIADKKEVRSTFMKTFYIALAVCLALLLFFSIGRISSFKPKTIDNTQDEGSADVPDLFGDDEDNGGSQDTPVVPDNSNSGNNSSSTDTNQGGQNTPPDSTDNNGGSQNNASSGLSSSSPVSEVVEYFNTAINKVKPEASKITLVKEENKKAGEIEGSLPGFLKSIAQSAIDSNMGVKAENQVVDAKSFPVENESWSSKLTADDIERYKVTDNGSTYTIVLAIKEDAPSESTAHGVGHNGKVFSVVMPSVVNDNVPSAAKSVVNNVKTGHKSGMVKVVIDKQSGHVTEATYYFIWTLSLKAAGMDISIPFGLQKDYSIAY